MTKIAKRLHKDNLTPAQQARFFRQFAHWAKERKVEYIQKISAKEAWRLKYTWEAWARDEQLAPVGDWSIWLCQAGRGWGKTRTGAQWVISKAYDYPGCHIALVGRTVADVRDVMVKGMSGILAVSSSWFMPEYKPSQRLLIWPNGSYATTYSADEPDQLRGPNHSFAWADERAAWQYDDTWDQLIFGLRIEPAPGVQPQCIVTTTPRNTKAMKALSADPDTVVTRGKTYDNKENLSPKFLKEIDKRFKGTRLGRQEIDGEIIDDIDGALWKRQWIEDFRVAKHPELKRIVVAVDPPASSPETSDEPAECGIVVCGVGVDDHGYVLADFSTVGTPDEWASEVLRAYAIFEADCVIGEVNNGGDMVGNTIKTAAKDKGMKLVPFKAVRATRGKQLRAEPISLPYQRGLIHHCGVFPDLEDQQCFSADTLISCEHGYKPISEMKIGDRVWTRQGLQRVVNAGCTNPSASVVRLHTLKGRTLLATMCHPVYNRDRGKFTFLGLLKQGDTLEVLTCQKDKEDGVGAQKELMAQQGAWVNMDHKLNGMGDYGVSIEPAIIDTQRENCFTGLFGKQQMGLSQKGWKFITRIVTNRIINSTIFNWLHVQSTRQYSIEVGLHGVQSSVHKVLRQMFGLIGNPKNINANTAGLHSRARTCAQDGAAVDVVARLEVINERIPVYNIEVENAHEYYANDILVHNCNWVPGEKSPDRLDACVWGFTELMIEEQEGGGVLIATATDEDMAVFGSTDVLSQWGDMNAGMEW